MSTPAGTEPRYFKASLGLKHEIEGDVARDYHSSLVEALRARGYVLDTPHFNVRLAREFGFCYGVDKAIDMAYETRRKFPGRRIFLTTELIHNPSVNRRMVDMGIQFLDGQFKSGLQPSDITAEDVVILPAFGVSTGELELYRAKGSIIVDTTCGSVVHVWKRVERYAREGFTAVIHGKAYHEETVATASQVDSNGGQYIIVRAREQAAILCEVIEGRRPACDLLESQGVTVSPGFDPAVHLSCIGVANQTTMLASESLEIARMIGESIARRDGEEAARQHFRSFDTICSATQDRQDAIKVLLETEHLDLMLVVGGYNSSNTNHLVEMAMRRCPTYHISDSHEILSGDEIRHKIFGTTQPVVASDWLPSGHFTIGITAGASTPNRAIGETLERVAELKGVSREELLSLANG